MTIVDQPGDLAETPTPQGVDAVAPAAPAGVAGLAHRWGWEVGVTIATAFFYAWALSQNGYGNLFYAASARSMSASPSNFFFAAFDPGGWDTVDKPPLGQWLVAGSAKVFGFSSWSLLLPSVLCGVLTVWLLMATVRRPWGRAAGLAAGVTLALTPIMLAVSRSNNPDALLILCCVAAAWAAQRGLGDGRLRWMLLAGACGGLGFLTKSLAVGPALVGVWVAYLVAAPGPFLRKRLLPCVAGGLMFLAVSGAWIAAVDLTPLSSRPWVGGSTDGSARDLVFGYNGLGRVNGSGLNAGGTMFQGGMFVTPGGVDEFGGAPGFTRLFNQGMGDQAMWLLPIAGVAAAAAVVNAIRRRRRDERLGSAVMWLGWGTATYLLLTNAEGILHNYYVSLLSPAIAALVGVGVKLVLDAGRIGRVIAAFTLIGTAVVEVIFLNRVDAWTFLRPLVPIGVAATVVVVIATLLWRSLPPRVALGALAAGLGVLLLAPAAWAREGVLHPQDATFPDARPGSAATTDVLGILAAAPLDPAEISWLRAQHRDEKWIVAVGSVTQAQSDVVNGDSIATLGGFIGSDASDTVDRVAAVVERGELRFVIVGGGVMGGGGSGSAIAKACTEVSPSAWTAGTTAAPGTSAAASTPGTPPAPAGPGGGTLYDCAGRAEAIRANRDAAGTLASGVPGSNPEGVSGGPGPPGGALPPGMSIPAGITPTQMKFGMCVMQHGGNIQGLLDAASGKTPTPELQTAIDACGGLAAAGPPPGATPPTSTPAP